MKVIEVTSYYDDKIPSLLAKETGARVAHVGGDVGGTPDATDYFTYMDSLLKAFAP